MLRWSPKNAVIGLGARLVLLLGQLSSSREHGSSTHHSFRTKLMLCACVCLHCLGDRSTLFRRSWRLSFVYCLWQRLFWLPTLLQISELFSHLQCALKRVGILQVKPLYTVADCTLNHILLTIARYTHRGLYIELSGLFSCIIKSIALPSVFCSYCKL